MHRTIAVCLIALTACAVAVPTVAQNTNGRWNYLAADMREWFKGLHAQRNGIVCCDEADGWRVDDVDWESKDGHYRVRLYGEWVPVPDETVVTEPKSLRSCGSVAVFRHRWDNAGPLLLTGGGRIIVAKPPNLRSSSPRAKRTRRTWRPFKAHPQMLRHACDYALANISGTSTYRFFALYRAVAGAFQGFLAAMTRGWPRKW